MCTCQLVPTVGDAPDPETGMWVVQRERGGRHRPLQVIPAESIARGAHVYGKGRLPEGFSYTDSLEASKSFFVNPYIDYHAHELLSF